VHIKITTINQYKKPDPISKVLKEGMYNKKKDKNLKIFLLKISNKKK
jgi:hypothetical protein